MKNPPLLIVSPNPLNASDVRSFFLPASSSIQEVLNTRKYLIPTHLPYVVFLNEKAVLKKYWHQTSLQQNDILTIATMPQKEIVASALTIFAIAASGPIGAGIGGAMFGAGTIGAGLTATAFSASLVGLVGSAAWAGTSSNPQLGIEPRSPSYSLYPVTNRIRNGQAIPVIYGRHRIIPDLIAPAYSRFENNGQQTLYQLFAVGCGTFVLESAALGNITIGEQHGFQANSIIAPGQTLPSAPGSWHTTLGDVKNFSLSFENGWSDPIKIGKNQFLISSIEVDLLFPNGIFKNTGSASEQNTIRVAIEYKAVNSQTWLPIPSSFIKSGGSTDPTKTVTVTKKNDILSFEGNTINPTGYSISWAVTPSEHYEIRMKNLSASTVTSPAYVVWTNLKGFLHSPPVYYNNVSVLALRLVANASTSGHANQRISLIVKRKIKVYNPSTKKWSQPITTNSIPFAIADMLTNTTYGAALSEEQVDLEALYHIDQNLPRDRTFNAVFDQSITLWESIKRAGRCAQIDPYIQGGKVCFSRDDANHYSPPVTLFGPHNIVKNSFKILYRMDDFDTPSQLSVEFINPEKNWTSDTITLNADQHYQQPLHTRVQLFGCTNKEHATEEGKLMLKRTLTRRRIVSFETELDGMLAVFGDTIAITHPLPSWGVSGIIEHYNYKPQNSSVRISEKVDSDGYLVVRFNNGSISNPIRVSRISPQELKLEKELVSTSEGEEEREPTDLSGQLSSIADTQPALFAFGEKSSNWSQHARVIAIRPKNRHIVTIEAVVLG